MQVGGQRLLGIPADQGYGEPGQPARHRPGRDPVVRVEVVDAKPALRRPSVVEQAGGDDGDVERDGGVERLVAGHGGPLDVAPARARAR